VQVGAEMVDLTFLEHGESLGLFGFNIDIIQWIGPGSEVDRGAIGSSSPSKFRKVKKSVI